MPTKFESMTESEKILRVYNMAFTHAQNFLFNPGYDAPELDEYKKELRAVLDWLKPYVGLEGARVY